MRTLLGNFSTILKFLITIAPKRTVSKGQIGKTVARDISKAFAFPSLFQDSSSLQLVVAFKVALALQIEVGVVREVEVGLEVSVVEVGRTAPRLTLGRTEPEVLPLEEEVDLGERGPLLLLAVPALLHEIPHLSCACVRRGEDGHGPVVLVETGEVGDDLLVGQALSENLDPRFVRSAHSGLAGQALEGLLAAKGQDLPEGHAEGPHVALG